jgi:hypothetical protein
MYNVYLVFNFNDNTFTVKKISVDNRIKKMEIPISAICKIKKQISNFFCWKSSNLHLFLLNRTNYLPTFEPSYAIVIKHTYNRQIFIFKSQKCNIVFLCFIYVIYYIWFLKKSLVIKLQVCWCILVCFCVLC